MNPGRNPTGPSFVGALLSGNLPLMNIRLDEEYACTFDKYGALLDRRSAILSDQDRRSEAERSGELADITHMLRSYRAELGIQGREKQSAHAWVNSVLGDVA